MTTYAGYSVETADEMTAIPSAFRTDRSLLYVGEKNRLYRYNASSVESPDSNNIYLPDDGVGRWIAVGGASSGGSGGGGGSTGAVVQSGKPTSTPTSEGIIVADSRSDRGVLWISVGTDSPDDWVAFGFRPITPPGGGYYPNNPTNQVTPDFVGQIYIATEGGAYGNTRAWMATGLTDSDWQQFHSYSNS